MRDVKPLTPEEANTIQVDAALRKMGELDEALYELNLEIAQAEEEYFKAKRNLEILKQTKQIIVERMRNLKA
ncbi:MAG: hypothetical protein J7K87_04585, partial [Candidatus Aenigmarchaeota archaeon]|nr:hypothetical protein [Candidatus Aenigmarchaeota archaeon]